MPRLALRNPVLALSAIALASSLTGLLPASTAVADRPASKAGAVAGTSAAAPPVTLGSKRFASEVPQYLGAGRVRPKAIGDGNTCEGQASNLKWKRWGSERATATGNMCDSPDGCMSACAQQSTAQAVAYDLGRCTAHGPRVYRRAKVRVRDVDSGEWSRWSSLNTFGAGGRLCRAGSQ
jgi:hypothetical protein